MLMDIFTPNSSTDQRQQEYASPPVADFVEPGATGLVPLDFAGLGPGPLCADEPTRFTIGTVGALKQNGPEKWTAM
jgi:hypothetical protein